MATKIIMDKSGGSKGYGFVTFETEEEARKVQEKVTDSKMLVENVDNSILTGPLSNLLHNDVPATFLQFLVANFLFCISLRMKFLPIKTLLFCRLTRLR